MAKYLDLDGLTYLWSKITSKFVAQETGKGLSTNDFTTAEKTKLAGIEAGAEVNDVTSVNGNTGAVNLTASDVGAQPTLVSGTNIKTINGTSILGSGDLTLEASDIPYDDSQTQLGNNVQSAIEQLNYDNTSISVALGNKQNKVEVVSKTASDTSVTLLTDTFYVFPTMATLSVTVTSTGMYTFRFTSGSTATTLTVTGATMPDSFTVEANKVYEVNIYQGYGVVSSWTAS